ncbi:Glutathione S-transferase D7 [Frankliniella fusca]|uniref:Glutathione S-transferase D7 n=1 Tax=Frankliniella fusca TaxID=407009 RepID=A0AAE1HJ95_9NEOP|nr:Glutathione S-transferase D7 [Frankliniella fusca]
MPVLYGATPSPPCRAVLLTGKAVGADIELKKVNPTRGETRTPEFLEMNPRHTIPVLDDDGFVLAESRAIMCYIVDKYGAEDDQLLPKDPQQRGRVLEKVMFDQVLYGRLLDVYTPAWLFHGAELNEEKRPALDEEFGVLDKYLEASDWVAGDNMTLADIALAVTVSQASEGFGYSMEPFANITRWHEACKSDISGYEEIEVEGVNFFKELTGK